MGDACEALSDFQCYKTKSGKGDICTDDAPVNAGGVCEREDQCGGTEDVTAFKNVDARLMCYQVKLATTAPPQSKHAPVAGVFVGNQFGRDRIDTLREDELCVPSRTTL